MVNLTLLLFRSVFRLSEWTFPSVGASLALRLFTRPGLRPAATVRSERLKRAEEILASAERLEVSVSASGEQRRTRVYRWSPQRPAAPRVMLVHGYDSSMRYMADFVPALLEAGFEVTGIDLPGHGESEGNTVNYLWATSAIQAVQNSFGSMDAIVGHSFGGAMSVLSATGSPPMIPAVSVPTIVLIAAPNRLHNVLNRFRAQLGFGSRVDAAFRTRLASIGGRKRADYSVEDNLRGTDIQVLSVHDRDDREVPFTDSEEVSALSNVSQHPVQGLGHNRILGAPAVISRTVEFLLTSIHGAETASGQVNHENGHSADQSGLIAAGSHH